MTRPHRPRLTGFGLSIAVHAVLALVILIAAGVRPEPVATKATPIRTDLVFLRHAGTTGGGGGGGNLRPAPPSRTQIPEHVRPVVPTTAAVAAVEPLPVLDVPVQANSTFFQGSGVTASAPPGPGPGAPGLGVGPGSKPGLNGGDSGGPGGPGRGAGTVTSPVPIREVRPAYTAGALAAKVQGNVTLELEVLANGTVGNVKVLRSLDRVYGLDIEAIKAAKQWLFIPGKLNGKPVDVIAQLILDFNLR